MAKIAFSGFSVRWAKAKESMEFVAQKSIFLTFAGSSQNRLFGRLGGSRSGFGRQAHHMASIWEHPFLALLTLIMGGNP